MVKVCMVGGYTKGDLSVVAVKTTRLPKVSERKRTRVPLVLPGHLTAGNPRKESITDCSCFDIYEVEGKD